MSTVTATPRTAGTTRRDAASAPRREMDSALSSTRTEIAPDFGGLMGALRSNVGMSAPAGDRVSPEQVFGVPQSDPGERRRETMKSEYRKDVSGDTAAFHQKRTGIGARKDLQFAKRGDETFRRPARAEETSAEGAPGAGKGSLFIDAASEPSDMMKPRGETIESDARNECVLALDASHDNKDMNSPDKTPESQKTLAPVSQSSSKTTGLGAAAISGPANDTAAGQLAKLISGAPGRDGESLSTVPIAPAEGGGRSDPRLPSLVSKHATDRPDRTNDSPADAKKLEETANAPFARLVRLLRSQAGHQSSARVMLDPPELGRVHVRVKVTDQRIELGVETETESAKDMISERIGRLRSAMERHGMVIDRFDISANAIGALGTTPLPDRRTGGWEENSDTSSFVERPMRSRSMTSEKAAATSMASNGVTDWSGIGHVRLDIRV